MKKKIFAVSDIHGHFTEFKDALDASGFENGNPEHLLIFCGDLFDRGNENLKVMQFFERISNCIMIRGNHEDMLLKIFDDGRLKEHNYTNGTLTTIAEFFGKYAVDAVGSIDFSGKSRTVDRITDLIMQMRDYYETEHYIFVHGWLPNRSGSIHNEWKNASDADWKNARFTKWTEAYSGDEPVKEKTIVCGHLPTFFAKRFDKQRGDMEASPFYGKGIIAMDGGTDVTGKVNIIVLDDEIL